MSLETLGSGGPIILVLAVLSLLSLALIVVKIHQLWPVRSGSALRARAFEQWKSGDKHGARQTVEGGKSPADRVTAYAMKALAAGFKGPALEAELTRRGNEEVAEMGSLIRLLELIAMVSPLLGPGLLVAIPAAVAAGLLSARIDRAAQGIESAVGELMLTDQNPNL